ncbi:PX-domain-containing protein [Aureobasidium pullulans]|uniref:PX-domain-containing protein n=1 Tax=Aureobasidium pullulans TaxID=5580 RepID=A0A4T0CF78_AURPU|nr:PX-domain-containing protein [Aureobasidium pullulans]THX39558.1 PX-domain-containing protein [Aureobasidium pullulans]THX64812.1 PX-domain-containing protein [Aureobasidium pullulans]THY54807.1 PX-domain-containing protein [Aureobasidium pullulans]THZ72503.1 PX-domain-containing protein [Aureobasidium pullulans]
MESAESETLVNGDTSSPRNKDQPLAAAAAATSTTHEDDLNASDHTAASSVTLNNASPHVIPPYFNGIRLERTDSATTATGRGIDLVDQSDEDHEIGRACWASDVSVDDYVVVSGPTGIGAYVVWSCTIETFKGGSITLRKRYSEFDTLRHNLVRAFPLSEASIPELPRKSLVFS